MLVILVYGNIESVWDFIGDIHGMASKLQLLLSKLGYNAVSKYNYMHPSGRKVLFLGDYIDRGPEVVKTLRIVKTMCQNNNALAIMGNHEFNLLCYLTKRRTKIPGQPAYVRRHNKTHSEESANTRQEFKKLPDKGQGFLNWLCTLPLFFETPTFCAVHASWVPSAISEIKTAASKGILRNSEVPSLLLKNNNTKQNLSSKGSFFNAAINISKENISTYPKFKLKQAIDTALKGREVVLPPDLYFYDNDGNVRTKARISWWNLNDETEIVITRNALLTNKNNNTASPPIKKIHFSNLLMIPQEQKKKSDALPREVKDRLLQDLLKFKSEQMENDKPVFFGHYWMRGTPKLLTNKTLCLDFSVARNGKLVAYRFNNEKTLKASNLTWV